MRRKSVGIRELKAHASEIVHELQRGDLEVVVTLRGKPVARMEAVNLPDRKPVDGLGGMMGALEGILPEVTWEDFMEVKKMWEPRDDFDPR